MEVQARLKGARLSAQKARLVADQVRGKGVEEDKKSLGLSVTMQPFTATMTEEEIDAVGEKIIANVAKQTGGSLRE